MPSVGFGRCSRAMPRVAHRRRAGASFSRRGASRAAQGRSYPSETANRDDIARAFAPGAPIWRGVGHLSDDLPRRGSLQSRHREERSDVAIQEAGTPMPAAGGSSASAARQRGRLLDRRVALRASRDDEVFQDPTLRESTFGRTADPIVIARSEATKRPMPPASCGKNRSVSARNEGRRDDQRAQQQPRPWIASLRSR